MEKRAVCEDEKDVCDITLNYIAHGSYPQDATKKDKCVIRKTAIKAVPSARWAAVSSHLCKI